MQVLQPHDFVPQQLDGFFRTRTGRMGLFYAQPSEVGSYGASIYNTKGAAAWSLRAFQYPTGAVDSFTYESDSFAIDYDKQHSYFHKYNRTPIWTTFATDECGIRISKIKTYDPLTNNSIEVQYHYGTGHLPGLPTTYLRNSSHRTGVGNNFKIKTLFDWSSNEVEYEWISRTFSDQSKIRDEYITAVVGGNAYYNHQWITTLQFGNNNCSLFGHLVSLDKSWLRGKIKRTVYYNSSHNPVSKENYYYNSVPISSNTIQINRTPYPILFGGISRWTFVNESHSIHYSHNNTDSLRKRKENTYNTYGLPLETVEYNSDSTERRIQNTYIIDKSDHPLFNSCQSHHILTPIVSKSLWERKSFMLDDTVTPGFIEGGPGGSSLPWNAKNYSQYY